MTWCFWKEVCWWSGCSRDGVVRGRKVEWWKGTKMKGGECAKSGKWRLIWCFKVEGWREQAKGSIEWKSWERYWSGKQLARRAKGQIKNSKGFFKVQTTHNLSFYLSLVIYGHFSLPSRRQPPPLLNSFRGEQQPQITRQARDIAIFQSLVVRFWNTCQVTSKIRVYLFCLLDSIFFYII